MNRRSFLKSAGAAAVSAGMSPACASRVTASRQTTRPITRHWERVRVSENRVIRTVVGLRPFRASGFVVRGERLGSKIVIHDYGHGGGGVTLSWGTAELAVREAESATLERRAAVIGAGAVGLATAWLMRRRGWDVTIYARELPPYTTSNIAGGQWDPTTVFDEQRADAAFRGQFRSAAELSYRHYQNLPMQRYGIRWIENYFLTTQPPRPTRHVTELAHLFRDVRELRPDEHPFPVPYCRVVVTMLVETLTYLDQMLADLRIAGVSVVVRDFRHRDEILALDEPLIMNCTGLGARELFGDQELTPIRGQLHVLLPQPEVDYVIIGPGGLYMFPRSDGVLLGGTFERGEWSLEPDPAARSRIITGHQEFFARMKSR